MQVQVRNAARVTKAVAQVLPVFEHEAAQAAGARGGDRTLRPLLAALVASGDFKGRFLEIAVLHPPRGASRRVLVVGLGTRAALTTHRLRRVAAPPARRAS